VGAALLGEHEARAQDGSLGARLERVPHVGRVGHPTGE
jgi:hypothetical protein